MSTLSRTIVRNREATNLELRSKIEHVATILVVRLRIAPDEAHFLLKRIPGLEIGDISGWCAAVNAFRAFRYALQRYWMPDDLVIVLQPACWEIAEWRIDFEAILRQLALNSHVKNIGCLPVISISKHIGDDHLLGFLECLAGEVDVVAGLATFVLVVISVVFSRSSTWCNGRFPVCFRASSHRTLLQLDFRRRRFWCLVLRLHSMSTVLYRGNSSVWNRCRDGGITWVLLVLRVVDLHEVEDQLANALRIFVYDALAIVEFFCILHHAFEVALYRAHGWVVIVLDLLLDCLQGDWQLDDVVVLR